MDTTRYKQAKQPALQEGRSARCLRGAVAVVLVFAPSLAAQTSGVLLGVTAGSFVNPYAEPQEVDTYETLWIVRDSARTVRARLPDLLVPRDDGFWRAGVVPFCTYSPDYRRASARDSVWRAPVDSVIRVSIDRRCRLDVEAQCEFNSLSLHFAGPRHLSLSSYSGMGEGCEPRGARNQTSYRTMPFLRDTALSIDVLGSDAREAFVRSVLDTSGADPELNCSRVDEEFVGEDTRSWLIMRNRGRWTAETYVQTGYEGCGVGGMLDLSLPREIVGHDDLAPSWDVIASRVAGLTDAVVSPRGDLVVAITRDSLIIFEAAGGNVGQRLTAVYRPGTRIVMAQWAVGGHVARWNADVARVASRGRGVVVHEADR